MNGKDRMTALSTLCMIRHLRQHLAFPRAVAAPFFGICRKFPFDVYRLFPRKALVFVFLQLCTILNQQIFLGRSHEPKADERLEEAWLKDVIGRFSLYLYDLDQQ